jgi:hypothetical protein
MKTGIAGGHAETAFPLAYVWPLSPAYIEPGSPWQNPSVESFASRVRDELLAVEVFGLLAEA